MCVKQLWKDIHHLLLSCLLAGRFCICSGHCTVIHMENVEKALNWKRVVEKWLRDKVEVFNARCCCVNSVVLKSWSLLHGAV